VKKFWVGTCSTIHALRVCASADTGVDDVHFQAAPVLCSNLDRISLLCSTPGRASPSRLPACAGTRIEAYDCAGLHPPCTCSYTCRRSRCSQGSGTSLYAPHYAAHASALDAPVRTQAQHSTAQRSIQLCTRPKTAPHTLRASRLERKLGGRTGSEQLTNPHSVCAHEAYRWARKKLAKTPWPNPGFTTLDTGRVMLTSTGSVRSSLSPTSQ
jgi:hypothetical protein